MAAVQFPEEMKSLIAKKAKTKEKDPFLPPITADPPSDRVKALRAKLRDKVKPDQLTDREVLMWVAGYETYEDPVAAIMEALVSHFEFRKKIGWKNLIDADIKNWQEVQSWAPKYFFGRDRTGNPILYDDVSSYKFDVLDKNVDEVIRMFARGMMRLNRQEAKWCKERDLLQYRKITIVDVKNVGVTTSVYYKACMAKILGVLQEHFPGTLSKCIIVNAGWTFRSIWAIAKTFLHEITVAQVIVASDHKQCLKFIAPEQLWDRYGGTAKKPAGCELEWKSVN